MKATAKAAKVGGKDMSPVQKIMETRVCGRPAVDGYAHVVPSCLEESPTNKWWQENKPQPDDLDIHIERHADYDGLAGAGLGGVAVAQRVGSVVRWSAVGRTSAA